MLQITEIQQPVRTPFAYCPPPSRRTTWSYRLSRDCYALPVRILAAVAGAGAGWILITGVIALMGRGR